MKIKVNTSILAQSRWYEYLIRFIFGGSITAATGLVAKRFGPAIGGLFLAFPAIFPATATLIEKHEKQKKERRGNRGVERARSAAGIDAAGAAIGSLGLAAFAVIIWRWLPNSSTGLVLSLATLAWLFVSVSVWKLRDTFWRHARLHLFRAAIHPASPNVSPRAIGETAPSAETKRRSDG